MVRKQAGLYLDLDVSNAPLAQALTALEAALGCAAVESVLIRAGGDRGHEQGDLRALVTAVQGRGIAALIEDDVRNTVKVGADGVHLPWSKDVVARLKEARRTGGIAAIVGADAGRSRHDAMELGEAGADYVAFGIPAHVEDRERARARQIELVAWWSAIFEVPCVAFDIDDAQQAQALAEAGADFIAVRLAADADAETIAARLAPFGLPARPAERVS